jgi:hypothetical protein
MPMIVDLEIGTHVVALRHLDKEGANILPGTQGEVTAYAETDFGPLVTWPGGKCCNVYSGDVWWDDVTGHDIQIGMPVDLAYLLIDVIRKALPNIPEDDGSELFDFADRLTDRLNILESKRKLDEREAPKED